MTDSLSSVPLFPLNSIILPKGRIPLQLFEPRGHVGQAGAKHDLPTLEVEHRQIAGGLDDGQPALAGRGATGTAVKLPHE